MSTVTSTRSLPNKGTWRHTYGATLLGKGTDPLQSGFQQTTSWRTRKGEPKEGEEVGDREFANHTDFIRALREEHQTQYDNGHDFSTEKYEIVYDNPMVDVYFRPSGPAITNVRRYSGYMYPNTTLVGRTAMGSFAPSGGQITSDGAKAIAATIPSTPHAGLSQFLGELREKFPTLIGFNSMRKGGQFQAVPNLGSEHLNLEFGLKPLVSDVRAMAASLGQAHFLIEQYKRNSDRIIRRATQPRVETSSAILWQGSPSNPVIRQWFGFPEAYDMGWSNFTASSAGVTTTRNVSITSRFVGAYTYHLSEAHNFLAQMQMYEQLSDQLLGSRFDIDTLYELSPWSWLLDWFTGFGTFLGNVTALANDNLVLRYGYIMHETRVDCVHTLLNIRPYPGWVCPPSTSLREIFLRKTRTKATPYGFGVDLGALSPRRWAILAALGMTRSERTLR